jgi:putative aldouronate transport system substrate-binding protein
LIKIERGLKVKNKRSVFIVLVFILSFGTIISACSKSDSQPATSATQTAGAAKPPIHILLSHSELAYAKQSKQDDLYIKELSRLSGYDLKYEFLGHNKDYTQQLSLRFASGELADLIRTDMIDSQMHVGAVDQGAFLELGPLIDKYAPTLKKKIPEEVWKSPKVSKNGKIYAIPVLRGVPADRTVFIRQDWLDKLKMDTPQTLEDYMKFFEAVKNTDMNGNGKKDEYGVGMFANIAWADIFTPSFGVHPNTWHMKDGQLTPDIINPKMKNAIAFYKQLYDKGYVNPDFLTKQNEDDHNASMAKGEYGMWSGAVYQYLGNFDKQAAVKRFVNQPGASVSMIAPPKGPNGESGIGTQNDYLYFVWVIPAKTKNPEQILKFLEWSWSSPEADKFFSYGIEGKNYTTENGQIKYEITSPVNAENNAYQMYQTSLNMREIGFAKPPVIKMLPEADKIKAGYDLANKVFVKDDGLYMPKLTAFNTRPELALAFAPGSLFLDMFAKVVTGKEQLDPAFDKFVAEWTRRGGDTAIKEATTWYNNFHKK